MTRTFNQIVAALVVLLALASTAAAQCPGNRCRRAPVRWSYRVAPAPAPPSAVYGVPAAGTAVAATQPGDFLAAVNAYRAGHGLRALAFDANLAAFAAANNGWQAVRGLGHHVNPNAYQVAAAGPGLSPAAALASWHGSPAHRAILLNPSVRVIGYAFGPGAATANLR